MRGTRGWLRGLVVAGGLVLASVSASGAQTLGPLRFRLLPFEETVTLTVVLLGTVAQVSGFEERAPGEQAAVYGAAFLRPDGQVGLGFTTVFDGIATQTDVVLDPATLSGTWRDDTGNAGDFVALP